MFRRPARFRVQLGMMSIVFQHIIVIALVTICVTFVAWQWSAALVGKRTKLGACCAKGCDLMENTATPAKTHAAGQRIAFMPVEMLARKK